jgi:aryl-alcohol dehydrogenase-like predicted oxidoreductase
MEYVRFGLIGMNVSCVCVGCMSYGGQDERWPWELDEGNQEYIHPACAGSGSLVQARRTG